VNLLLAVLLAQAPPPPTQAPPPPTSTPVPRPVQSPAQKQTPSVSAGPVDGGSIDPRLAGVPIYTGATFLQSFDLDKAQTVFMFGTNDSYATVVGFYKGKIRGGQEVSKTPQIQQFDLGNFDSGTMTQRPSVVVKDFTWPDTAGYLHVSGTKQTRYLTIIQIIPK
jgi:hypothetical protein